MNPMGQPFGEPPQTRNPNVNIAAILMMVAAAMAILLALLMLLGNLMGSDGSTFLKFVQDESLREKLRQSMAQQQGGATKALGMMWPLVMLAGNAVILFGGFKMMNGQLYTLALIAAILSTIPCCFSYCCCVFSMPAGIFALVILLKPEVKASFVS